MERPNPINCAEEESIMYPLSLCAYHQEIRDYVVFTPSTRPPHNILFGLHIFEVSLGHQFQNFMLRNIRVASLFQAVEIQSMLSAVCFMNFVSAFNDIR